MNMENFKLITEAPIYDYQILEEQANEKAPKSLKIKGIFLRANKKNINGREYSYEICESASNRFNEEFIKVGRAFGELNHPTTVDVNFERACIRVLSLNQDESDKDVWIGEAVVLASDPARNIKGTPFGDILASILQHGGIPGVSSRGVGIIGKGGAINSAYRLVAEDVVSNPSTPGGFVNGILESKNFVINQYGEIKELVYENFEKGLVNIPTHSVHTDEGKEYLLKLVNNFINNL